MNSIYIATAIALFFAAIIGLYIRADKSNRRKREKWEYEIYSQVINDLERGKKRVGLWRMAMQDANGIEETCKKLYIKYCTQSIIGEHDILGTAKY